GGHIFRQPRTHGIARPHRRHPPAPRHEIWSRCRPVLRQQFLSARRSHPRTRRPPCPVASPLVVRRPGRHHDEVFRCHLRSLAPRGMHHDFFRRRVRFQPGSERNEQGPPCRRHLGPCLPHSPLRDHSRVLHHFWESQGS